MERRDLLRQRLAEQPLDAIVDKMLALEEQLRQREEELAEARAFIAELKPICSAAKPREVTPEQAAQVQEIVIDLEEQQQRPEPLSQQVLKEERKIERERRPVRHPLSLQLETETVVLQPEITRCSCCGPLVRIGEEVSEEMDWVPAKLIRRRTIRPSMPRVAAASSA